MMKRKKGGAKLSFQDIQAEEDDFRYDAQNLRGLTPDEVLQQLAEEEADEIREARAAAKARLREAGKLPQLPEPPKAPKAPPPCKTRMICSAGSVLSFMFARFDAV